jgi:uncharacterized SAM-binding protein YcdF (DUF218 family)
MERSGGFLLKAVGALIAAYVLGFLLFAVSLPETPDHIPPADGIVVLTGGGARVDKAEELLESGAGRRLLISGVNASTTKEQLKLLVHGGDRFNCCADLGFTAADTRGNATEAAAWVAKHHYHSLIVVTANYHMRRSMAEFSADMPGVRLEAYPVAPEGLNMSQWWRDPRALRLLHSEYAKFLASLVLTAFDHKN